MLTLASNGSNINNKAATCCAVVVPVARTYTYTHIHKYTHIHLCKCRAHHHKIGFGSWFGGYFKPIFFRAQHFWIKILARNIEIKINFSQPFGPLRLFIFSFSCFCFSASQFLLLGFLALFLVAFLSHCESLSVELFAAAFLSRFLSTK